jgi:mRNA interferase RelE/StbE
MGRYELVFRKSVAKDLRAIPNADVERILNRIRALADDPRPPGSERLSGQARYRIRQGRYRIVYEIEDARLVVLIVRVAHRRDVYRDH